MVLFGWLVLTIIASLSTLWVGAALIGDILLTGKSHKRLWLLILIPALMWWGVVVNCPLVVSVAGGV